MGIKKVIAEMQEKKRVGKESYEVAQEYYSRSAKTLLEYRKELNKQGRNRCVDMRCGPEGPSKRLFKMYFVEDNGVHYHSMLDDDGKISFSYKMWFDLGGYAEFRTGEDHKIESLTITDKNGIFKTIDYEDLSEKTSNISKEDIENTMARLRRVSGFEDELREPENE